MFEREIRSFDVIKQWGTLRVHRQQSLAEHSFYVALYAEQINRYLDNPVNRGDLLQYALWHDAYEMLTGDVPGPWKRIAGWEVGIEGRKRLQKIFPNGEWEMPVEEAIPAIVKVADVTDQWLYLAIEASMGNGNVTKTIWEDARRRCFNNVQTRLAWVNRNIRESLFGEIQAAAHDCRRGDNQYVTDP